MWILNVRGWSTVSSSDNFLAQFKCLQSSEIDIFGVAESHLRNNDRISLVGYTWIGNNSRSLHVNAHRGSGGVDFIISKHVYDLFDISILDISEEDILWIKLRSKMDTVVLCLCVCYFAPANSSRQMCADDFYKKLLNSVCLYQSEGTVFICGDLNSQKEKYWIIHASHE